MDPHKTLLDGMDMLGKRRVSDAVAKGLRRYSAKVRMTRKHFSEAQPYTEQITLSGKSYTLAVHTEGQNVVWVIHDPATLSRLALPNKRKLILPS